VRSLQILVEKSVVKRYRVEVPDEFDATDQMALQELFAEGVEKPEPHESDDDEFHATVEEDLQV
jgi:hypothetical protein